MSKKQAFSDLLNRKPVNTEIHEEEETPMGPKKKATYELDLNLHTDLKIFAAKHNKKMVEVVEDALKQYLKNHIQ